MQAKSHQRGVTLIVCLIFLLLLTIIGVGAMRTATLQERMAGNTRDADVAFQAAETALRDGEGFLASNSGNILSVPFSTDKTGAAGLFDCRATSCTGITPALNDRTSTTNWITVSTSVSDQNGPLPHQPQYFIEELAPTQNTLSGLTGHSPPIRWFRITARGFGSGADLASTRMVVLQSYYRIN